MMLQMANRDTWYLQQSI